MRGAPFNRSVDGQTDLIYISSSGSSTNSSDAWMRSRSVAAWLVDRVVGLLRQLEQVVNCTVWFNYGAHSLGTHKYASITQNHDEDGGW